MSFQVNGVGTHFEVTYFDGDLSAVALGYPHSPWFGPSEEPGDGDFLYDQRWLPVTKETFRLVSNYVADTLTQIEG